MTELFGQSVEEVFRQHLGIQTQPCKSRPKGKGYMAAIPFSYEGRAQEAILWIQAKTLKKTAEVLLFEENPDEETLKDLCAELANFVVGHAKMAASDRQIACEMGTPRFLGHGPLPAGTRRLLFKIEGRCMALTLKGSDGDHAS
ncbi:MAG: chemotaxis protein CheX [Epsilonproteobacteria bacterium]|nr:chemotaxis protein CheX [Campylobacterota bacterium]